MSLLDVLTARIASQGPITVAEYMTECLMHPQFGYYATRDPLGAQGDFITAPEISQMFGELIGLSLAQAWIDQGRPAPFTLAEAGPGRGTLMADLLRATEQISGFHQSADIVLIETSPALRAVQKETLAPHTPRWTHTVETLPQQPLFFVANEFFDALPIRQFQRDGARWRERQIGLKDCALRFGLGPAQPQPALDHRDADTRDGDLVEECPSAAPVIDEIGRRIADYAGVGLVIDYGDWRSLGDTLQAVKSHQTEDPLQDPGNADLTAHVDFEVLAEAAPCQHTKLTPQGVFLERLGITPRAQALAKNLKGASLDALVQAHRRLTHPDEMGQLFKVLGLYPEGQTPPPGLDA